MKIAALSGSLRADSWNTKLIHAFANAAPENVEVVPVLISDLPFINQDLEQDLPEPVKRLHDTIQSVDAVLLATPEYNRSYSPVTKNALDWGSRPSGMNVWAQKPVGIIGCTPYNLGTVSAQNHLRQVIMYLDMYPMQQPEFYLDHVADKVGADGTVTDQKTQEKIDEYWTSFIAWINNFVKD